MNTNILCKQYKVLINRIAGDIAKIVSLAILMVSIFSPYVASAHVAILDGTNISCGSLDSTDLTTHTTNQIESRILQTSSTTGLSMYSNRDFSLSSTTPWTPNPDSWTKKGSSTLDFTGVAAYLVYSNGTAIAPNSLGTLISPRHFIAAAHYAPNIGHVLGFIDANGNRIERTITGREFIGGTDIAIGVLDSDLPDSITYYPLIASSTLSSLLQQYTAQNLSVPIVYFDQEAKALIHSIYSLGNLILYNTYTSGEFAPYSEEIISGDSGNPQFILVDNQPVLLSTTLGGGGGGGPSAGAYINEINTAMTNLGGGYQVTQYNPACFTQYPANHRPVFSTSPSTNVITYEHVDSSLPLITYAATDADSGQTLTYGLVSLTTATTTLNASDYFSINPTTGVLTQTHDLSIAAVGSTLTLTVSATDNAQYTAQATISNTIGLRSTPQAAAKIVLDTNFALPTIPGNTTSLFVDSNDKVLIGGGYASVNGVPQNGITRLNSSGLIDMDFATNIGSGVLNYSDQNVNVNRIFTDSQGKIVFVPDDYIKFNGVAGCNIGRLNTDGTLDTSFACSNSNSGYGFSINGNSGANVYAATKAGDKLLVTGNFNNYNGTTAGGIALLNPNGTLDTDFNTNFGIGINGIVLGNGGKAIAFDGDHSFYVAGTMIDYVNGSGATTTLHRIAKFDINGTFDSSFNTNVGTGFSTSLINVMKVRHDGKIVIVGNFQTFNGVSTKRILLLNPDGTLDTDFTTNTGTGFLSVPNAVYIEDDDKMIIGGSFNSYNGVATNGLVRLNKDGTLDTDFQNALGSGITGTVLQVAKRSDGALVTLGGYDYNGTLLNYNVGEFVTETPVAPVFTVATTIGSTDAVLLGTGSTTATVSIYDGGNLVATTTVNNLGFWQKTISLSQGTHTLTAKQTLSLLTTVTSPVSSSVLATINLITSSGGGSSGGGSGGGGVIYYPTQNPVTTATSTSSNSLKLSNPSTTTTNVISSVVPLAKIYKLLNKSSVDVFQISLLSTLKINLVGNSIQVNSVPLVSNKTIGSKGEDVRQLQKLLNALGFVVSKTGSGSIGQETSVFGVRTQYALSKFQKANGISPASGYFGPLTRTKILNLLK